MRTIALAIAAVAVLTIASTPAVAAHKQRDRRVHRELKHRAHQRDIIHNRALRAGISHHEHRALDRILAREAYRDQRYHSRYHRYSDCYGGYYGGHHRRNYYHSGFGHSGIGISGNRFSLYFGF